MISKNLNPFSKLYIKQELPTKQKSPLTKDKHFLAQNELSV